MWERERRKHTIQGGESVYVRGVCGVPRRRGGWPRECRVNRPVNSVDSASRLQSYRVTETTLRRAGVGQLADAVSSLPPRVSAQTAYRVTETCGSTERPGGDGGTAEEHAST